MCIRATFPKLAVASPVVLAGPLVCCLDIERVGEGAGITCLAGILAKELARNVCVVSVRLIASDGEVLVDCALVLWGEFDRFGVTTATRTHFFFGVIVTGGATLEGDCEWLSILVISFS